MSKASEWLKIRERHEPKICVVSNHTFQVSSQEGMLMTGPEAILRLSPTDALTVAHWILDTFKEESA